MNFVIAKKSNRRGLEWRITDNPLASEVITGFYFSFENMTEVRKTFFCEVLKAIQDFIDQVNYNWDRWHFEFGFSTKEIYKEVSKKAKKLTHQLTDSYHFIKEW